MSNQLKDENLRKKKAEIRNKIIDLRKSLSPEEIRSKSLLITDKLIGLEKFSLSRLVMTYMSFNNEVETGGLIKRLIETGKRIAVPLTVRGDWKSRHILPCEIKDMETGLAPGTYGILEPTEPLHVVDPKEIDLVIVPGVAFDLKRNRIGFGAGYYDRFLSTLPVECIKIGLAFDLQVVDEIPAGEFDIPLNMIITESRVI